MKCFVSLPAENVTSRRADRSPRIPDDRPKRHQETGATSRQSSTSRNPIMRPSSYWQRLFVEHDLGESSGSAADAVRRAGYPWTGQMTRKMLRNVEKRGVQAARNGPSPPPTPAGGPVAKPELGTADRLGSRERAAGATHFAAPMSACRRSTFTRSEHAFGS